jgi:hypothetical protein
MQHLSLGLHIFASTAYCGVGLMIYTHLLAPAHKEPSQDDDNHDWLNSETYRMSP